VGLTGRKGKGKERERERKGMEEKKRVLKREC
jgi:hypothetical protein